MFDVEIAPIESGTWVKLNGSGHLSTHELLNVGTIQKSFQFLPVFRLKVYNSSVLQYASPAYNISYQLKKHDYLIWREMFRRESLGLNKYIGTPGYLLRRMVSGTPCPRCLDEILNDPAEANCPVCYGTSFNGGYYSPQFIAGDWVNSPPVDDTVLTDNGVSEASKTQIKTLSVPIAKFKDIWVDASTNTRYEIQKRELGQFRGYSVTQILEVSKLPATDISYRFPVDLTP